MLMRLFNLVHDKNDLCVPGKKITLRTIIFLSYLPPPAKCFTNKARISVKGGQ